MIRAKLESGMIACWGDQEGALALSRIPGCRHLPRTPIGTFALPLNLDTFAALGEVGAQMDAPLLTAGQRAQEVQRWVDRMKEAKRVKPVKPVPIKAEYSLYQHQIKAFNLGIVLRSFAALMDMGTGKSLTTVAITGRRFLDGKIRRVLIAAPSSVCPVWPREYGQFADFPHRVAVLQGTKEQRLRTLSYLTAPVPKGAPEPLRVAVINYAELEGGEEITANNVLTRLLRLQQLTGGFLSGDDGKPTAVNHAKLDALEDIVQAICIDEGRNENTVTIDYRIKKIGVVHDVSAVDIPAYGDTEIEARRRDAMTAIRANERDIERAKIMSLL